jgi:hypothetical protein
MEASDGEEEIAPRQQKQKARSKNSTEDPHGMVGKSIMVPGTWWKGVEDSQKTCTYKCKVVRYNPKCKFDTKLSGRTAKATWAPVWYIVAPDAKLEYQMCWIDLVSFMDKKDRPVDVGDDEILEPEELVPGAGGEDTREEEEEGEEEGDGGAGGTAQRCCEKRLQ